MTRPYVLGFVLLFASGIAFAEGAPAGAPLGVEALIENVAAHKGALRVRGIVGKTVAEKQLFSLVDLSDREELLQTGKTQCVTLPVRWTQTMPTPNSVVVVSGKIEEASGRSVFVADSVTAEVHAPPKDADRP